MEKSARALLDDVRAQLMETGQTRLRLDELEQRSGADEEYSALSVLRRDARRCLDRMWEEQQQAENLIASVANPRERAVLRLRYLEGMSWEMICQFFSDNNYPLCERQIYRVHSAALRSAETVLAATVK